MVVTRFRQWLTGYDAGHAVNIDSSKTMAWPSNQIHNRRTT